jgi:hypothetical protein
MTPGNNQLAGKVGAVKHVGVADAHMGHQLQVSSRPRKSPATRMNACFQGFSPSAKLSLIR